MKKLLSVCLVAVFFVVACGANLKSEQNKWTKYQELKTDLETKWPNLKPVINSDFASAKKMMDEAQAISDDSKKAEKMKEANAKAGVLLDKLRQVRDRLSSTQKQINKLSNKRVPVTKSRRKTDIISQANSTIAEINQLMTNSTATNVEETQTIAKTAISKLISTAGSLSRFEKSLKKSKSSKKKKKKKNH